MKEAPIVIFGKEIRQLQCANDTLNTNQMLQDTISMMLANHAAGVTLPLTSPREDALW